MIQQHSVL